MKIKFDVSQQPRKRLAEAIAEAANHELRYLQVPTFAYKIGELTIDREGTLDIPKDYDGDAIIDILTAADQAGFKGVVLEGQLPGEEEQEEIEQTIVEPSPEESQQESEIGLTIAIPLDAVAVGNLTNLLTAKGKLIAKALGIEDTRIELDEDKVIFPWFKTMPDADSVKAYTDFIAAICKMSKEAKRISAAEKAVDNEKYAFRCFLLRLGMIGAEYKTDRKILLQNLEGSAAFKNGAKKEAGNDAVSE